MNRFATPRDFCRGTSDNLMTCIHFIIAAVVLQNFSDRKYLFAYLIVVERNWKLLVVVGITVEVDVSEDTIGIAQLTHAKRPREDFCRVASGTNNTA